MAVEYLVNATESAILYTDTSFTTATERTLLRPNKALLYFELIISGIIIISALFGNLVVVNTLWRKRKNLTRMHFFIYHLCIADILSALLSQFPVFVWDITFFFYGPDFLCKLMKFCLVFPIYLSSYILILTAFDRYLAICHPLLGLRGNQKLRMRTMVAVVWLLSALFSTPQMCFFGVKFIPAYGGNSCSGKFPSTAVARAYVTLFTLAVFIVPSTILALIYGQICSTVWQNMAKATGHKKGSLSPEETEQCSVEMKRNGNSHRKNSEVQNQLYRSHTTEARVSRAKIKTIKMTLTIVTVYVICWSPFFFSILWGAWAGKHLHSWVDALFHVMANINACTNPWIYLIFSGNVGGAIKDLFWICNSCQQREHHPVPNAMAQGDEHSGGRFAQSPAGPRTATTSGQEHEADNNNANATP